MWTRREVLRALLVALLAFVIYLLVDTVRKEETPNENDKELDAYKFCHISPSDNSTCVSVHGLLVLLSEFCGLKEVKVYEDDNSDFTLPEEKTELEPDELGEHDEEPDYDIASREESNENPQKPKSKKTGEAKSKEDSKEEESSPVIYQIIGLLLIVSVTFSLVECTKEKWARSKQAALAVSTGGRRSFTGRQDGYGANRRMSLADLTISRHERRENQASYRPPAAEPRVWTRRSSAPGKSEKSMSMTRQVSWPHATSLTRRVPSVDAALEEDAWAERRRVRMLHRH